MNFLISFIIRVIKGAFNQRNLLTLPLNFMINFAPVFIWLFIFHHAALIPKDIRPTIHSKIAFLADNYMFGDWFNELNTQYNETSLSQLSYFSSIVFMMIVLVSIPMILWYYFYYVKKTKYNITEWYDHVFHFANKTNPKRIRVVLFPFLTPLVCFILLNIMHTFASQDESNFVKWKDLLAWTSYVIFHVTVPIVTAVYLYVFHPAGVLKCFSLALGLQNICGVFTHLLFPTASPWFTHLYGINDTDHVSYDQEGYAAGLVRVDTHLGTHLNTNGFHLSPIVFGAVPSLHSAIAFQCVLFILTRSTSLKHRFISAVESIPLSHVSESNDSQSQISAQADSQEEEEEESTSNDEEDDFMASTYDLEDYGSSNKESLQFVSLYIDDKEYSERWYFKLFNKGLVPKIIICSYICLQWWATMYLDHHYRFDLFIGMLYALASHLIINWFVLQPRVLKPWLETRMGKIPDSRNEARTLGMRVFQGTKIEWFFDPLA